MFTYKLLSKGAVHTRKFCNGSDKDTLRNRLPSPTRKRNRVNLVQSLNSPFFLLHIGEKRDTFPHPLATPSPFTQHGSCQKQPGYQIYLNRQKLPCTGNERANVMLQLDEIRLHVTAVYFSLPFEAFQKRR